MNDLVLMYVNCMNGMVYYILSSIVALYKL